MRLKVSRSKNAASLYVTKTIYENSKQRTVTVEKLGTEKELRENFATLPDDPKIREDFANYYGVPDLYNDWIKNPNEWNDYKEYVNKSRYMRDAMMRHRHRLVGIDD